MPPFEESLSLLLMRARERVMQRFRPHLRAHGVTEQQWRVLRVLAEGRQAEMQDLASRCCIYPASLSRIVPRLEAAGVVERRSDPADQRRIAVSLTEAGRALFTRVAAGSDLAYAALQAELGAERMAQIAFMLGDLLANLPDRAPGAPE